MMMGTHDFKAFFEFSNDLLSIANLEGYFIKLNSRWAQATGFSLAELTAKPFLDFVHPEDQKRTARAADTLSTSKSESVHFENRYRTRSGAYLVLEWNSVIDRDNQIIYSIARDITSYKKREVLDQSFSEIVLKYTRLNTLKDTRISDFITDLLHDVIRLFDVDSVSYWVLSPDRRKIVCANSAEGPDVQPRLNQELLEEEAPTYFQGILSNKLIAADDASWHPCTREFNNGYLQAFNVHSMLDAQVEGEFGLWGIVCLESSEPRNWSFEEQNMLLSLTSVLSVALLNHERQKSTLERERLSHIINSVSEGVIITDREREVTWINKGFERVTGYELSDIQGMKLGDILRGPETAVEDMERISRGVWSKQPFTQEILNYTKGGHKFWSELYISPYYSIDGDLEGYYGFQKDITRRKIAEEEQAKLNRYFQHHHELATRSGLDIEAILKANVQLGLELFQMQLGIISKVNGDLYQIHSIASEGDTPFAEGQVFALEKTLCYSVVHSGKAIASNDVQKSELSSHPAYMDGGLKSYMGVPIFMNGQVFGTLNFSSWEKRPVNFNKNEIALLEMMADDLSKQLEFDLTQQRLRSSEERYRSVVDSLSEGIVVQDMNDAVTMCNEAAANILGLTTDQLIGKDSYDPRWKALDMNGEPIRPEAHPSMVTSRTGQPVRGFLMDVWKSDGSRAVISINSEPVVNEKGEMYSVVASFSDVTAEVYAKRSLEQSKQRIENIANSVPGALLQYKQHPEGLVELLYISEQAQQVWGVPKGEALADVGLLWSKILREDVPGMKASMTTSAQELSFWEYTYRMKGEDGSIKWLNTRGMPRRESDGSVIWDTLALDVTALKDTEIDLKQTLEQKNLLFRELHHRIKNNLNMVNNLLYLRARFTKNQELLGFIKDTQNRILSIAKTYDMLLKLEEFDRLYTKEYLEYLLENLMSIYASKPEQYELRCSVENHKLHVDKLATLGLLVFEIVTNIFKYAYDEGEKGLVVMDLKEEDGTIRMLIADQGKGIEDLDAIDGNSLGMSLIKAFIAQLKGQLRIEVKGGVSYDISFPMS